STASASGIQAASNYVTGTMTTGSVTFTRGADSNTKDTISNGTGDWLNTNFVAGAQITISSATSASNNATFTIDSVSSDGKTITLTSKQVVTSETGTSVTVKRSVSAHLDEPVIALTPVKDSAVTTVVNFTPATFDSSGGVSTYD